MSGILLRPEAGGDDIVVSTEKTVIGRGTFLKITDKRVSRNHANLEINDKGSLVLTPVHTNPCFLRVHDTGEKLTLPKDEARVLNHGDVLGLLPDTLFYKVIYENQVSGEDNCGKVKVGSKAADQDSGEDESESEQEEEKPVKVNGNEEKIDTKVKVVKTGNKEMALPVDKKRVLPKWMVGAAKRVALKPADRHVAETKTKPQIATNARAPKRKQAIKSESEEEVSEENSPPRRGPKKGGRGATKRRKKVESEEEDWEEEEERPQRRGRRTRDDDDGIPHRQRRASAQKKLSYSDDIVFSDPELEGMSSEEEYRPSQKKDDDSDFVMDEPDSGSDWEVSHSQSSRRGKGRGRSSTSSGRGRPARSPRAPVRSPGRASRGRPRGATNKRKNYREDSDDDFSDENGDAYIPRPSKSRRGRQADSDDDRPRRNAASTQRGRGRKPRQQDSDSDEDSEEESEKSESEEEAKKPQTKGRRGRPSKRVTDEDDDDSGKSSKSQGRRSCWYGKKCYRKNPQHFEEFCHPGDDSFEVDEVSQDKPNKKAKPAVRAKREKDIKSILHGASDDDGEANTYDYNDSFLVADESADRVGSSSASERPEDPDDSDWDPEESVGSLVREAKSFKRNKKMQQPARNK